MPEAIEPVAPVLIPAPEPTGSGAVDEAVAIWRALAALGVRHAVAAPGSRSAPLVYGLALVGADAADGADGDSGSGGADGPAAADGIPAHVRIDERAAAFTALGLSRADPAHPAAVFTTSGTAVAHLLAAVMEAHHARVPLLVLTADRPAELRGTGANQTTVQPGLMAPFVRFAADLPAPAADAASTVELRTAVSTVARAVAAATGAHPGPVHLNLGFRDPLVPTPRGVATPDFVPDTAPVTVPGIVLTRRTLQTTPQPEQVPVGPRTVVVAGDGAGPEAARFAAEQGLPLLAEPSSGSRRGEQLVPGYPALLPLVMGAGRAAGAAGPDGVTAPLPARPDRAIVLGRSTLSRGVGRHLLGADDVEVIVVDPAPGADWSDPTRRASRIVAALDAPAPSPEEERQRSENLRAWQDAGRRLLAERTAAHSADGASWQESAALAVWEASGPEDVLVLGSSSLVRDLELSAPATSATVIANRGLAGIDGTAATAGGIALARARRGEPGRVRLLMGDLTALHDLTGLLVGPEEERPALDVIVVDDGGGRIFGGLEHAAAPPALLRRFFTTPHGADIAAVAAGLGADARTLAPADLPAALAETGPEPRGLRVLVVREDEIAQEHHSSLTSNSGDRVL
ncbi:2-succinyl-5-enolpyruvyl-6-hydroxy-3-cyclohexene-1-carboxylic-acid synthase [Brachybacterium sp. DNPG3]